MTESILTSQLLAKSTTTNCRKVRLTHRPTLQAHYRAMNNVSACTSLACMKKGSHLRARMRAPVKTRGSRQVGGTGDNFTGPLRRIPFSSRSAFVETSSARVHAAIYYSLLDFALGFVLLPVNNAPRPTK